jgi:hypothetical protein
MECIQADPVLFFTAVGTLIYLIYTGKLRPPHKQPKPAAPVDLRPLTADQLYYAPLVALEAEEQRLHGVYLDSQCRNPACRARIDDVRRAINWQVIGGPRPTTPSTTTPSTPSTARATRRSTALVVVPTAPNPATKPLSSIERWKQIRHG